MKYINELLLEKGIYIISTTSNYKEVLMKKARTIKFVQATDYIKCIYILLFLCFIHAQN